MRKRSGQEHIYWPLNIMAWRKFWVSKAFDVDEESSGTNKSEASTSWVNSHFEGCLPQVSVTLPDCLVPQPASITLVEASLVGSLELLGGGNHSTVLQAGLLGLDKGEGVSAGGCTVVKHHTWGKRSCGETAGTGPSCTEMCDQKWSKNQCKDPLKPLLLEMLPSWSPAATEGDVLGISLALL